jgi:predicted nucleic acid-binding protein
VIALLDVNVLMALLWGNHEQHTKVRAWFKSVPTFANEPILVLLVR